MRRVSIVPHTHWDREWYAPFQTFRMRLVELLDGLIPQLESDPDYRHFLLDGQMAVIDDYLAIRPQAEVRLRQLALGGRVAMGPWYILMDEFLVSGETIIRDMEVGLARAATFGGAMDIGYLPDMFGHIAQMPQLLAQFGFEHAVVWRGVPAAVDRSAFWWEAPDGSKVRAEYLVSGYSNGEVLPDTGSALLEQISKWEAEYAPLLADLPILWMNGTDHLMPQPWLGRVVAEARALTHDLDISVTSLAEHVHTAPTSGLPVYRGELRSGARANLLMGVASNRVDVRQAAARVERSLERIAEPLSALLLPADEWPEAFLEMAWLEVIRNAAHDSICACSHDDVCLAVLHRYAEAGQIADGLIARTLRAVGRHAPVAGPVIVNPSARARWGRRDRRCAHTRRGHTALWVGGVRSAARERAGGPRGGHGPRQRACAGRGRRGARHSRSARCLGWVPSSTVATPATPTTTARPHTSCSSTRRTRRLRRCWRRVRSWPRCSSRPDYTWPQRLDSTGAREGAVDVEVRTTLELRAGERFVRVTVAFDNRCDDHRVRAHFPLPSPAGISRAECAFTIVERGLTAEGGPHEPGLPTFPSRRFVQAGGLTLAHEGLLEYELVDVDGDGAHTLALTLLRASRFLSRGPMVSRPHPAGPEHELLGSQARGSHELRYVVAVGDVDPYALVDDAFVPLLVARARGGGEGPPLPQPSASKGRRFPRCGGSAASSRCVSSTPPTPPRASRSPDEPGGSSTSGAARSRPSTRRSTSARSESPPSASPPDRVNIRPQRTKSARFAPYSPSEDERGDRRASPRGSVVDQAGSRPQRRATGPT